MKNSFGNHSFYDEGRLDDAYDIIGDIAIVKVTKAFLPKAQKVAERTLTIHRNVRTVLAQTSCVTGEFRLRPLTYLKGENKTKTVHKEFGCLFSVDVSRCYFSPRLSNERQRIARAVKLREVVVNMFAGAGCFSIMIAKIATPEKVYSIDINPAGIEAMKENIRLNRVYGQVLPIEGDAKEICERRLIGAADRVLMPLPEKALEYMPTAVSTLKASGGWIHYYGFEHAEKEENPVQKAKTKVTEKLSNLKVSYCFPFSRIVRTTGPNWYQVVLDINIKKASDKS